MRCPEKLYHLLSVGGLSVYLLYGMLLSGGTAMDRPDWFPLLFLPLVMLFAVSAVRILMLWSSSPTDPYDDL